MRRDIVIMCGKWKIRKGESFGECKQGLRLSSFSGLYMNFKKIGSHYYL